MKKIISILVMVITTFITELSLQKAKQKAEL